MQYLADTQCDLKTQSEKSECLHEIETYQRPSPNAGPESSNPCEWKPTNALRRNISDDTNLNTLGGTCGMPQHFHGTISVRVPGDFQQVGSRWIDTVQNQPLQISGDGAVTRTDSPLRPMLHRFHTD
eukprot:4675888-Prymnesium_polylepis.1